MKPSRDDAELFALFAALCRDTNTRLREVVLSYLSSTSVTFWSLSDGLVAALSDAHSRAAYLGRLLAGKDSAFGDSDRLFAASVMAEQAGYLHGLLMDLQTGKYGVSGHTAAISAALANRLWLYCVRLRGTCNEAWALNLPPETMLDWVLGQPETNHCQTCPQRAIAGPYAAGSVTFNPGDGSSECGVLCLCEWQIVGGGSAFPPISL